MWKTHTFVEAKVWNVEKHMKLFFEGVISTELVLKTLNQAERPPPGVWTKGPALS